MHLSLIKGETKSVFVPLYDPEREPVSTSHYELDDDSNIVLKLNRPVPEAVGCSSDSSYVFLSGAVEGCFEVIGWNECRTELTLRAGDCIQLTLDRGRYINACCCAGVIHIPPAPIEVRFAVPFLCGLDSTIAAEIKTHVCLETCRKVPHQVVPINENTLSAGWIARECLPVGSLLDFPELGLSDVRVVGSSTVNNRFLHLAVDKAFTRFNCAVSAYHSCDSVVALDYRLMQGCPILEVIIDSSPLVSGAVYHWDLFVAGSAGMSHFHRDSFSVESSY